MKNLKHLRKRGLAMFLALVMCLSLVQVTAFAEDDLEITSDPCACGVEGCTCAPETCSADSCTAPCDACAAKQQADKEAAEKAAAEEQARLEAEAKAQQEAAERAAALAAELQTMIDNLPAPETVIPEDQTVYNQIAAVYSFAEANGLLLTEAQETALSLVSQALTPVSVIPEEEPAQVTTFQELAQAIGKGQTYIKLGANIELTGPLNVKNGENITIDGSKDDGGTYTLTRKTTEASGVFTTKIMNPVGTGSIDHQSFPYTQKVEFSMFDVRYASLTLKNVTIDGGANRTIDSNGMLTGISGPASQSIVNMTGVNPTPDQITSLVLDGVTIQNVLSTGNIGVYANGGNISVKNSHIKNCTSGSGGGAIFYCIQQVDLTLGEGTVIEGNYAAGNGRGALVTCGSNCTLTMESGSSISNNYFRSDGVVCAGGNSSKMVMNGGQINGNIYVCRTSITNYNQVSYGSAVHVLPSGEFVMNGGEICNNVGFRAGAITIDGSKRADFNGGTISGNQSKEETGYSVMIAEVRGNPPVGDFIIHENMIVDGAVWLNDYNTKLTNAGTINGSVYMKCGAWDEKTGAQLVNTGTITGNIELEGSPYGQSNAAHLVNTGTVNGVVTLLGHGATISSSQELDIKSGSPDYMVLKESVDGTVTYTLGEVNEPVLNRTSADLVIGNTLALTTIIMPKDEADAGKTVVLNSKVVWSSNNESVATVDENGNVTAISEGIAIISAKVGNDIVFCSISVSTPYYPSYIPTFTPTYPTGGTGNGGTTGGTTITDPDTPLDDGTTITDDETPLVRNPLLFRDVPEDMWCRDAVAYVFDKGLMKGISDTVFAPAMSTERGMIVTILHRLEGEPTAAASSFTDVAAGKWYTDAIAWGAANGVVEGYSDTIFKPTQDITREQLAAILFRYAQLKGYDTSKRADLSAYTDAGEISAYALEAMRWAVAEELISGVTSYTLVPSGRADRAQVATILMRFCENIVPA